SALLSWDQEFTSDLEAVRRPGRDAAVVQRIGDRLRDFVTPLGWADHAPAIVQAAPQGRPVLLTGRSAAARLFSLAWESLHRQASGQPGGETPGALMRYEWPETTTAPEDPTPRAGGGRILVAWSAAGGAVPAASHLKAIWSASQSGFHAFTPARDV